MRDAERLEHILAVLVRRGFGHYLHAAKLVREKRSAAEAPGPVALRETLEELGPTFVKLGQVLALRPDIVPVEYCEELRKLQDEVEPLPFPVIKGAIEKELGAPLQTVFPRFTKHPLAAASVAQVHAARLKGNGDVVVKVERPGVRERFESDIDILSFLARHLDKHHPRLRLPDVVTELRNYARRELDFLHELRHLQQFHDYFSSDPHVAIPKVHRDHSTNSLLIIEHLHGIHLRDAAGLRAARIKRSELAAIYYQAMFDQVFGLGTFHADPHPGNLLALQKPRLALAFIDFGIVGVMDKSMQQLTRELLAALHDRDARRILWVLLRLGTRRSGARPKEIQRAIALLLAEWREGETRPSILFYRMLRKAMAGGLDFPPDLLLLAKAFITMEGTALYLDPAFSPDAEIPRLLTREAERRAKFASLAQASRKTMAAAQSVVEEAPLALSAVLDRLEEGRFDLRLDNKQFVRAEQAYDLETTKIALALITAALFIGASVLLGAAPDLRAFGWPLAAWGFLLFGISAALFGASMARARRFIR